MRPWVWVIWLGLSGCAEPEWQTSFGDSGQFSDFHGHWLVVNYWAEWCAPCRKEIPELNELDTADNVRVLGVNFDAVSEARLAELIPQMGIEFAVLLADPGPRWLVEQPKVLPTTLLIDPEGALVEVLTGPQTKASLEAAMVIEVPEVNSAGE